MPIVTFLPSKKRQEVPTGTTLFEAALAASLPVASSCQSELVCGKCHLEIIDGERNLSPATPEELRLIQKERLPTGRRISCAAQVRGDCTVRASYW